MAGLSCGIVGLPNVGKSTLFNAITANQVPAANYPFCTIDPSVGTVEVLDERLEQIAKICKANRIIYATTELVDIAGLVKGAANGEGLGNAFLSNIKQTDAIIHVVRCFESNDIIHVMGRVHPIEDIEIINLELILSDLNSCENSVQRLEKQLKTNKEAAPIHAALVKVRDHLNKNLPVRTCQLTPEEKAIVEGYNFLSGKKVLYACNVSENDLPEMNNKYVQMVREYAEKEGNVVIPICAKIEEEISQLPPAERKEFLESLGLKESGLQRLVKASFKLLGLMTFLTAGEIEARAWTIHIGMKAPEAAGKIHSDIEKGFIRAEVISADDYIRLGGKNACREAGKMRLEGRDYVVQDGDIINFLHSG